MARKTDDHVSESASPDAGLVVGGRGGREDELLEAGQEEVFSRTEVESGRIEHQAEAGGEAEEPDGDSPKGRKRRDAAGH